MLDSLPHCQGQQRWWGLQHRYEDRRLCVILGVLARGHAARQVEADVVMDLNEQG